MRRDSVSRISLADQKKAIDSASLVYHKHILIWGPPRSGKTHIIATAAKSPHIDNIYWFDLEKGLETVLYARTISGEPLLTPEEMAKIIPFQIPDSSETPYAAETILRTFRPGNSSPKIDQSTGRVSTSSSAVPFNLKACGDRDLVVIDSLSQLGDSILAVSLNANTYKDLRKYYGDFTLDMIPILTAIQAAQTNIICATHTISKIKMYSNPITKQQEEKILGTYPLCGSRNFSEGRVAKHFNYLLYPYTQGTNYKVTEKIGVVPKVEQVGCRRHVSLVDEQDQPTLVNIFNPKAEEVTVQQSSGPAVKLS